MNDYACGCVLLRRASHATVLSCWMRTCMYVCARVRVCVYACVCMCVLVHRVGNPTPNSLVCSKHTDGERALVHFQSGTPTDGVL